MLEGKVKSAQSASIRPRFVGMKLGDVEHWWDTAPIEERRALARSVIDKVMIRPAVRRGGNVFDESRVQIVPV